MNAKTPITKRTKASTTQRSVSQMPTVPVEHKPVPEPKLCETCEFWNNKEYTGNDKVGLCHYNPATEKKAASDYCSHHVFRRAV